MEKFLKSWRQDFQLRNLFLIIYSITVFTLIWSIKNIQEIDNYHFKLVYIAISIFLIFVFTICSLEITLNIHSLDEMVYIGALWIFCISVIIAVLIRDMNTIVASATLLLVIITAFSVKKTTDIAQKQLKFQIDPIVSMSIKENDSDVRIIDLVIENVGNGIAKNIQFDISPHGFITWSGDPLERLYFFQRGIQILPPKQKFVIHLVNFAQKIQGIRERYGIPQSDSQLSPAEAQNFRRIVRSESELEITVYFENNEGVPHRTTFNFNLCIFWGLRFPL